MIVLALSHHDGIRLAELGLALAVIAGVAFFLSALAPERAKPAVLVGGGTLAVGAVLVLIAVHWGRFG